MNNMNHIKTRIVLFVMLVLSLHVNAQSVSYAKSLMEDGKYLEAAKQLRPLADGGDAEAQYLAATLFYEGKGVNKSSQQGAKYATLAADQGYEPAVLLLAGNAKDEAQAFKIISSYCDRYPQMKKNASGQILGMSYMFGIGVEMDMAKGLDIIEGLNDFAQFLHDNEAVRTVYKEYYRQQFEPSSYVATMTNTKEDEYLLAAMKRRLLLLDNAETKELFEAWLQYAQETEQPYAMAVVSNLYLTGWGTSTDMTKAKEWAQRSAHANAELGFAQLRVISDKEKKIEAEQQKIKAEQRKKKEAEDKARRDRFRIEEPSYAAATCNVSDVRWKDGKLNITLNVFSKGGRIDFGSGMKICLKKDMSLTDTNGKRLYNHMRAQIKGLEMARTNDSSSPTTYILPSNKTGKINVTIDNMPSQGELGEIVLNLWFFGDGGSTVRIKHLSWGY